MRLVREEKRVRLDGQGGSDVEDGVLRVESTDGKDTITLSTLPNGLIEVKVGDTISYFHPLNVSEIVVEAAGDDTVRVLDPVAKKPIRILGGPEGDEIRVKAKPAVRIAAGGGDDDVRARGGSATVLGGAGDDHIYVRDGNRDRVNGGSGRDSVVADRKDIVKKAESIDRR